MIRFASLGSGSRGNSLVVDAGDTKLLLDCGFSARATVERLGRLAVAAESIDALLLTHEHSDHVAGAFRFARRFDVPVYLSPGTLLSLTRDSAAPPECRLIDAHAPFVVGDVEVHPFPVPHDAREPVQYVFSDGVHRLGVLTDSGAVTQHIVDTLQACDALVLECNHDRELLAQSTYPAALKRRIAGAYGHLENAAAATLLRRINTRRLRHVVAAHLSEENNRPELARRALAEALDCRDDWIGVADQQEGFAWRELR